VTERVITDFQPHVIQCLDLRPGHIPVFTRCERIKLRDVEGSTETVGNQQRSHDRVMAEAGIVKGQDHGLRWDRLKK